MHEDNQGAKAWGTEGVRNAKHVTIRTNYVKEAIDSGTILMKYCPSAKRITDVLTKPLLRVKFQTLRDAVGVLQQSGGDAGKRGRWI